MLCIILLWPRDAGEEGAGRRLLLARGQPIVPAPAAALSAHTSHATHHSRSSACKEALSFAAVRPQNYASPHVFFVVAKRLPIRLH
jgi:hypothetical protein